MSYTKGPWKVGKPTDALGYETPIYADTDEGRKYEIATVHIYNGEQKANAQLISSVPSLYEALKGLLWITDVVEPSRKLSEYRTTARLALKKAEGKDGNV